jgi:hypothetical protein
MDEWIAERAAIIWADNQELPFEECERRAREMWENWNQDSQV